MNNINFARLISHIAVFADKPLTNYQVEDMEQLVKECNQDIPATDTSMGIASIQLEIDNLFNAFNPAKAGKIDAIKAYRMLTHRSLKESKDAVEALIVNVHTIYKADGTFK